MEVLEMRNVNKKIKDKSVLTDISLKINQGEIVGLIGGMVQVKPL